MLATQTEDIHLQFLDHIGLVVSNMETSIAWYQKVLGLRKVRTEKWGDVPTFLLAGKTGLALFPLISEPIIPPVNQSLKVDHFAFRVNKEDFVKAKQKLTQLNIPFTEKDHYYFHSIYFKDPDKHVVELTCIVVNEAKFYDL